MEAYYSLIYRKLKNLYVNINERNKESNITQETAKNNGYEA